MLAAGKHLYRNVNVRALCEQAERDYDSWVWLAEIFQTRPNLPRRVKALYDLGSTPLAELSLRDA